MIPLLAIIIFMMNFFSSLRTSGRLRGEHLQTGRVILHEHLLAVGKNIDTHQHAIVQALPGLGGCPKGGWVVQQVLHPA